MVGKIKPTNYKHFRGLEGLYLAYKYRHNCVGTNVGPLLITPPAFKCLNLRILIIIPIRGGYCSAV